MRRSGRALAGDITGARDHVCAGARWIRERHRVPPPIPLAEISISQGTNARQTHVTASWSSLAWYRTHYKKTYILLTANMWPFVTQQHLAHAASHRPTCQSFSSSSSCSSELPS